MNGKKAKQLRRQAQQLTAGQPHCRYDPAPADRAATTPPPTRRLTKTTTRWVYRTMKTALATARTGPDSAETVFTRKLGREVYGE